MNAVLERIFSRTQTSPPPVPRPDPIPPQPPAHYTSDDLPSILRGYVTPEDTKQSRKLRRNGGNVFNSCAVATALRRMYPGIEDGRFYIAIKEHYIGDRHYEANIATQLGISKWSHGSDEGFEFVLVEKGHLNPLETRMLDRLFEVG